MFSTYDKNYWQERYTNHDFPWDLGRVSIPIKEYVDQLKNKQIAILIPGAGLGHEAAYLYDKGFRNVTIIEWCEWAVSQILEKYPQIPQHKIFNSDFFEHAGKYDLIMEQTFFCALPPSMRSTYVQRVHELLKVGGKLVGVWFNFPLTKQGPPYGGSLEEYQKLFEKKFDILKLEKCYNSVPERKDKEFFIIARKKIT
ncbi:MAG: SAM-dependent methyltransferase [Bacteroidia bacterium]|nr:TPMT family class I SAM-dependent methyltransferase [Bacteroidia bacterium]MDW8158659.1 SAM-dependent methyltransferase [Bacteroidia bacterium]